MKSIGILGGGNMASAILKECETDISVLNSTNESTHHAAEKIGAQGAQNIDDLLSQDLLMLGVKPQRLGEILKNTEITQPIISLLAMTTCEKIHETLNSISSVTRIMPTMGSKVDKGITALYFEQNTAQEVQDAAKEIALATGKIIELEEEQQIEAFTIYSSSMIAILSLLDEKMKSHIQGKEEQEMVVKEIQEFLISETKKAGLKHSEYIISETYAGLRGLQEIYTSEEIIALVASKGGTTEAMLEFLKVEDGILEAFFHYPDIHEVHVKFFDIFKEAIDIGLKKAGF